MLLCQVNPTVDLPTHQISYFDKGSWMTDISMYKYYSHMHTCICVFLVDSLVVYYVNLRVPNKLETWTWYLRKCTNRNLILHISICWGFKLQSRTKSWTSKALDRMCMHILIWNMDMHSFEATCSFAIALWKKSKLFMSHTVNDVCARHDFTKPAHPEPSIAICKNYEAWANHTGNSTDWPGVRVI